MFFRRLYNDALAQASYLLGCQETHEAIVIDPLRDLAPYLEVARQENLRIAYVTETHVHADFLSGAAALAEAAGAQLLLSGEGEGAAIYRRGAYPTARWVKEGDTIQVGRVRLDVRHVPGHTPEHIAFLVTDEATSAEPLGLLSGDFLFAGDVGRPDLLERAVGAVGTMEHSARALYASLQRLRALPEYLQVWPGHGAGSACGKALGAVPQSTLGYELRANWAFAAGSEQAFVREVLAGQPEPPRYFARMKRLNREGGRPSATSALDAEGARRSLDAGAPVVDVRPPAAFAAGHLPGALNIPLGKSFLEWAGMVLDPEGDFVLVAAPESERAAIDAARTLPLIGIEGARGVLAPADLATLRKGALEPLASVPATSLGARADGATVVDVRRRSEWEAGHVPGAIHLPLAELAERVDELRGRGPLLVHCQGGSRSAVAASVLRSAGLEVSNVLGGYGAWLREGFVPATGD